MDIYILNSSFEKVGIVNSFISAIWTTRYYSPGDFELCVGASMDVVTLFQRGMYLVRDQDIIKNGIYTEYRHVMRITNRTINVDSENGDQLIVTGKDLKSILYQRVIIDQTVLSGSVLSCVDQLVDENITTPVDEVRQISNFAIVDQTASGALATLMKKQITGKNLGEAIGEICMTYGVGYDVYFSTNGFAFYFEMFEGEDRSYNQSDNPYVVFSNEFGNLLSCEYVEDASEYANSYIVAGEGEGVDRTKVMSGTASGIARYEIWVDQRTASSNSGEIPEVEYLEQLRQDGLEAIREAEVITTFAGEIDGAGQFAFGNDFFLGDVVQIETDYGINVAARIISVIESENETGYSIIPAFTE